MKPNRNNWLIAFSIVLAASSSLHAQTTQIYQTSNSLSTWNTTDANWDAGIPWVNDFTNSAQFDGIGKAITVTTVNVANLTFNGTAYSLSGSTLTMAPSATITTANDATISSILAGAGTTLTKEGSAILTFSGSNTYTGQTIVNAGRLKQTGAGTLNGTSSITINNGGTLEFAGNTNGNAVGTGNKAIAVNAGGTLLITGSNPMGYSGQTNMANVTLNGGTITANNIVYFNNLKIDTTGTINGSGALQCWQTTGDFITANTDATIAAGIRFIDLNPTIQVAAGKTLTVTGILSNFNGAGQSSTTKFGFNKTGTGTLLASGANNYGGLTNINAGTLKLGSASALGGTSQGTSVASGAVLDLNGQSIGAEAITLNGTGISAGGALTNSSATNASLAGNLSLATATSISGSGNITLSGVISGSATLTKLGTNELTVSGNNTYSGAVTIAAGAIRLAHIAGLGTNAGSTTVQSGATLDLNGMAVLDEPLTLNGSGNTLNGALINTSTTAASHTGAITLASDTTFGGSGNLTLSGAISGSGNLTKVGVGNVVLSNTNTYGTTTILNGTLILGHATNTLNDSSSLVIDGSSAVLDMAAHSDTVQSLYLVNGTITGFGTLTAASFSVTNGTITTTLAGSGALTKSGPGTVTLNGDLNYAGNTILSEGSLTIGSTGRLHVAIPASGASSKITGAGSLSFQGELILNLAAASALTNGSWTLCDSTNPSYGTNFKVRSADNTAWTAATANTWTTPGAAANTLWTYDTSTGVLSLTTTSSTPTFENWITTPAFNVPGNQTGANDDPDGDGVSNLMEYALAGRNPGAADGPTSTLTGMVVSFQKRTEAAADPTISYKIEVSNDLGLSDPWTEVASYLTNDASMISATISSPSSKRFARLIVTKATP